MISEIGFAFAFLRVRAARAVSGGSEIGFAFSFGRIDIFVGYPCSGGQVGGPVEYLSDSSVAVGVPRIRSKGV